MTGDEPNHLPRRDFFRDALRRAVSPLVDYLERTPGDPGAGLRSTIRLRPPGAIPEDRFSDVCRRCGACVRACPAFAIVASKESGPAQGTPVIDADISACVVCDGLQCTHVCPSGALQPIESPGDIRMGTAEVYGSLCVRTLGESCTECVDRCPIGITAIRFDDDGPPTVLASGCVGCGVCQFHCPTTPKAIVVSPPPRS